MLHTSVVSLSYLLSLYHQENLFEEQVKETVKALLAVSDTAKEEAIKKFFFAFEKYDTMKKGLLVRIA